MNKHNVKGMLAVLYGSAFVAAFNENIINVALVSIMAEFSVDTNIAQWLVTGYMVVTTIVVTVTAFLSKRLALRTLFWFASAFLLAGGIGCLVAPSFPLLLIFRLIQAIGTGIFIPVMMSTVMAVAPRKQLGTFLSIGGCMITFGPAFAPVISGLMVTWLGWRSVFLPTMVVMVVLVVASIALVKNVIEPQKTKLDVLSVLLSATGLSAFVFGLSILTTNLFTSLVALALGLAIIVCFALRQRALKNPLLDLSPLSKSRFSIACILVVVAMMTTFSMSVLLPLYFEGSLGMTALASGALLLPPILVNAGTSLVGGRIMDRCGSWPLLPIGFALITVGQLAIFLIAPTLSWISVLVGSIVVYAGVGLIFSPSQAAGLQTLPPEQSTHGVAIVNTFVQMAACIGPSLFIGVLSSTVANASKAGMAHNLAQAEGFASAVAVAAAIAFVGCVVALLYTRSARTRASTSQQTAEGARVAGITAATDAVGIVHGAGASSSLPALSIAAVIREPFLVQDSATVRDVMLQLVEHKTSGLPVVNKSGQIVGFVSDGDVLKTVGKQNTSTMDLTTYLALYRDMRSFDTRLAETLQANVMDIATTAIVAVSKQDTIDHVCSVLSSKRIKKVPVLEGRRVIGTISRSDVVRTLMAEYAQMNKE